MELYGFFRSGASYRCRIAFNLKGVPYRNHPINFRQQEQKSAAYADINPQMLVPALKHEGRVITQSLAIIEWLDEEYPAPPLLPRAPMERAEVRAFALTIAADTHPINNLRVLEFLKSPVLGHDQETANRWYRHWTELGLSACEELLRRRGAPGRFCFGDTPTLADICLIPQLYGARRYDCSLESMPRLRAIEAECLALPSFAEAAPEKQLDAVT